MMGMCFCVSAFGQSQTPIDTDISSHSNITEQSSIYHIYATTQAKRVWGESQEYTPEQKAIIKKIEEFYAKLDADYQADQLKLVQDGSQALLQQNDNKPFFQQLEGIYQTTQGNSLSPKIASFQLKKQHLLRDLPQIISKQETLRENIDSTINKDKS